MRTTKLAGCMIAAIIASGPLAAFAQNATVNGPAVTIQVTGTKSKIFHPWRRYNVYFYDSKDVTAAACGQMAAEAQSVKITCSAPIVAVCWDDPKNLLPCQHKPLQGIAIEGGGPINKNGNWHLHSSGNALTLEPKQ